MEQHFHPFSVVDEQKVYYVYTRMFQAAADMLR